MDVLARNLFYRSLLRPLLRINKVIADFVSQERLVTHARSYGSEVWGSRGRPSWSDAPGPMQGERTKRFNLRVSRV